MRVERRDVVTRDGWRIALHRYPGQGHGRRLPVICCHGLASNHIAFDVSPNVSLARHLARRGYDVMLVNLRGHGASERRRLRWAFDDYVLHDVPAILDAVGPAHWIGHSMGGIVALAYLARGGDALRSVVTVGSALDYSGSSSGFHRLVPLRSVLRFLPAVPVRSIARASARLVGKVRSPYERFNVWSSNCDPRLFRRICERGFHPVSPPVMEQLATALMPGGLRSLEGEPYLPRLASVRRTQVLALAGSRDAQCPPSAVERTVAALGDAATIRVFGVEHGHRDHYGHFDLLMGRRARGEVYPHIDAWLDRADAPAAAASDSSVGSE
jgi:pimeloyl-ACP methyl ester carboxylesterase